MRCVSEMGVESAKSTSQTGATAQPTNAGDHKRQEGWFFLPINRLSYDSIIIEVVVVAVGGRSLPQSFDFPLIPASFMHSLPKPKGDKCWGVMSNAPYLQSSTGAKKVVTRLPSALSIFRRMS